jgi:hypothetical protein
MRPGFVSCTWGGDDVSADRWGGASAGRYIDGGLAFVFLIQ